MKKFVLIASLLALVSASSFAQKTVDQTIDYTGFRNIEIKKAFEVEICPSETYSVQLSVDERIAENVIAAVNNNTLILDVDEKSYSKELKKELKAKNSIPPVLRVKVFCPVLNKIIAGDKAIISASENIKADDLSIEFSNSVLARNLVIDAKAVKIKLLNKANARFDIYANEVEYSAENSSSATMVVNTNTMIVSASGSSVNTIDGEYNSVEVHARNSSITTLSGNGNKISVEGSGSASVNADALSMREASVKLSNSSVCKINAKDNLKVELLGSSHLIYNSAPKIEVERIVNSTMTRSSDTKYNKNK